MSLADSLVAARLSGGLVPPPAPLSLADGYALAADLYPRLGTPAGWKVGATSPGAQAFLGVAEPIRGRLHRERLWRADGERIVAVVLPGDRPVEVEPEVVLRVGPDLAPDAAWFGIEVNRPSFADPFAHGVGAIVADNAASVALLLGPALPLAALGDPAALTATIAVDGVVIAGGSADAVLGDPRRAYGWLRGCVDLRPGDLVATGAMGRSAVVGRSALLVLDAPGFGAARFRLK